MGNHGVWADDEIPINVLQLFIMHTSTGCALNLVSPKKLPKQCTQNTLTQCYHVVIIHTPSTLDPGKYMYQAMSAYWTD